MDLDMDHCKNIHKKFGSGFLMALICCMLSSMFALNFVSNTSVSASNTPDYLFGKISNGNLSAAQATELIDKVVNYKKSLLEKSNGNLSRMNTLLLDDLEKRNIINETDKQQILSLNTALNEMKPTSNFTLLNKNLSTQIENLATNSSNPVMVGLKDILKRNICTPIIGIDENVCLPLVLANSALTSSNNLTNRTSGLPSMTVNHIINNSGYNYLVWEHCMMLATLTYGGVGMLEGAAMC